MSEDKIVSLDENGGGDKVLEAIYFDGWHFGAFPGYACRGNRWVE